jgi:hypothetical protein
VLDLKGKKMTSISKRGEGISRLWFGHCQICGEYGKLTKDHVPPKGAIQLTKIEQKLMSEVYDSDKQVKGIKSNSGSYFQTICKTCNSVHIGTNDGEVSKVFKKLHDLIFEHIRSPFSYSNTVSVDVDARKFLRAMIGHVLSATNAHLCKDPINMEAPDQKLRDFVLGDDSALDDNYDIYYWYYPYRRHISARHVGSYNKGHNTVVDCLHFFPMALLVTKKNEGTYPTQARKLKLTDRRIDLGISARNLEYAQFPFGNLADDQFRVSSDQLCITSMPLKSD